MALMRNYFKDNIECRQPRESLIARNTWGQLPDVTQHPRQIRTKDSEETIT